MGGLFSLVYPIPQTPKLPEKVIRKKQNAPLPIPPELSLLYATRHFALFYVCTMYRQNIPKAIRVTEQRQNI